MPKPTNPIVGRDGRRHQPLEADIIAAGPLKVKTGKRKNRDEDAEDKFVDSKSSRRILQIGQELVDEDEEENRVDEPAASSAFDFSSRIEAESEEEVLGEQEAWGDEDEDVEEEMVAPEDREMFDRFNPMEEDQLLKRGWTDDTDTFEDDAPTNLTDLILQKIQDFEAAAGGAQSRPEPGPVDDYEIPGKVVEVYTKVGYLLARYKSGKLPKPFKILPTLPHWEDIIEITNPQNWTANACYEATRIFVSRDVRTVQRFFEIVLLEKVRDDIRETKHLNLHLFNALKKGLYKPSSWFKGILFPLVESGTCTLREASIISGVLVRVSVPVLHSAAAIQGLCHIAAQEASAGTVGGGATNIFIKALLDKKYALPYQVVDSLVFHFLRFRSVDPAAVTPESMEVSMSTSSKDLKLPVIWHQCLLAFAQRYRNEITEDQREALLDMLLTKDHKGITPEIRRELLSGRGRGVALEPEPVSLGGDDTLMAD